MPKYVPSEDELDEDELDEDELTDGWTAMDDPDAEIEAAVGGLRAKIPLTWWMMLIGTVALTGLGIPGVFETSWAALKPGGAMVVNVVTIEGELHLYDLHEKHGGNLVRMDVSHLTHVGRLRALKPRMAVTQWRTHKPW